MAGGIMWQNNIVEAFDGEWVSTLPGLDTGGRFELWNDKRIARAAHILNVRGSRVLELGALEGCHSWLLQSLGAVSVHAIESDEAAYQRCLAVKVLLALNRVDFERGDFHHILTTCDRFDVVFACGVLYHSPTPVELLSLITSRTSRLYLWTHYTNEADATIEHAGRQYHAKRIEHVDRGLGSGEPFTLWLTLPSLIDALTSLGWLSLIVDVDSEHENGPAVEIICRK